MNIKKENSFESLQEIEEIISAINDGDIVELNLDSINKRHGALRDAARLQALTTISRTLPDIGIEITSSFNKEEIIQKLSNYAPGLVALRLNKYIKAGSCQIQRREGLQGAVEKMTHTDSAMYEKIIKGRNIDISCVSGAERQYMSPLFNERNQLSVKNGSKMSITMIDIFRKLDQFDFNDLDGDLNNAFGVFACELFKNTQEHACTDKNHRPYIEHVEGLIASGDSLKEHHKKDFMEHDELVKFWKEETTLNSEKKEIIKCRQISFFDTGPGIVARAFPNSKFTSKEDEKKALIQSIKKSFTSKKQSAAGQGYPTILSNLSRVGGLIRIRTGKQCLFNYFDKDKHGFWEEIEDIQEKELCEENYLTDFKDWSNKDLSMAQGTVVTILVPLRGESGQRNLF